MTAILIYFPSIIGIGHTLMLYVFALHTLSAALSFRVYFFVLPIAHFCPIERIKCIVIRYKACTNVLAM